MLQEERLKQIEYVVNNAKHVSLNHDKLEELTTLLKEISFSEHPWAKYKDVFSEKEIILLSFYIESMNFCFWKEPIFLYKDQKKSTAMMEMFIDAAVDNKDLLKSEYILNLKYEDLIDMFKVEEGNLRKRYDNLLYTAKKINDNPNFFDELFSVTSTEELYKFITSFKHFNDVSRSGRAHV